jgi:hypothetical protein
MKYIKRFNENFQYDVKENVNISLADILKKRGDLNHLKGMDVIVVNGEHKGEKAIFHEYRHHEPIKNSQGEILAPAESLVSLTLKHSNIHSDIKPEDLLLDVEGFNAGFNENLNLSDFPYINADDDEISFVDEEIRKYLGIEPRLSEEELDELSDEDYEAYFDYVANIPGKLEIHGNHVYYDESDKEIMKIMVGIFPNDFRNGVRIRE